MPQIAKDLIDFTQSNWLKDTPPSGIRAFDVKVSSIPGIIKLTLGEPDLNTPEHVKQAAIKSIENNDSHYSAQVGTLELRKAISNYLKQTQSLDYDPNNEVIVTVGATEALTATVLTFVKENEEVIVPTPSYALYFSILDLVGGKALSINTATSDFILSPDALKETIAKNPNAKAIILNYPTNPTGREYSSSQLEELAEIIRENHLFVISDEIYGDLVYDLPHTSIAQFIPERTLVISGLSKSHAMTGYRIGYVAGPSEIVKWIAKMHGFMVTAPSNPAQSAATEALNNGAEDPIAATEIYRKRRDYLTKSLNDLGLKTVTSDGAFYLFVKVPEKYGNDDWKFAEELAQKGKVAGVPGSAFGSGGKGYIRFSYAASDETLKKAVRRIKEFMINEG